MSANTYKMRLVGMFEEGASPCEHRGAVGALRLLLTAMDERAVKLDCVQVGEVPGALRTLVPIVSKFFSET